MERHCSVETKFPIKSKRSICVLIEILINATKVGLETRIFGNGMASFGQTGPTCQEHKFWRWTTLNRKFLRGPKCSLYFSTEISDHFGIMETPLDYLS